MKLKTTLFVLLALAASQAHATTPSEALAYVQAAEQAVTDVGVDYVGISGLAADLAIRLATYNPRDPLDPNGHLIDQADSYAVRLDDANAAASDAKSNLEADYDAMLTAFGSGDWDGVEAIYLGSFVYTAAAYWGHSFDAMSLAAFAEIVLDMYDQGGNPGPPLP